MASELAIGLSKALTHGVPQDILEWGQGVIDKELQEVRGVLSQTADRRYPETHGHCWCRKDLTDDNEPHSEFCQRARALMERLRVPEARP
jgi:hypothetical protein